MLKKKFATQAEIPAGFESLYKEQDGAWVRDDAQIEAPPAPAGAASTAKLESTLAKVRSDLKAAEKKLAVLGELTPEDAVAAVTERDDLKLKLETAGEQKPDAAAVAQLVKDRVALATAPLDRKVQALTAERDAAVAEREGLKLARKQDKIVGDLRDAAVKSGILKEAVDAALALKQNQFDVDEDGKVVTKDVAGVLPGQDPMSVFNEMKTTHPFMWATSVGGDAKGSGPGGTTGPNPYTKKDWSVTAQGQLMAKDPKKAAAMAAAAGVDVHAIEPKQ